MKDKSLSSKNNIYYRYQKGAKDRNIPFSLNYDELINMVRQNCFYCGEKPSICFKVASGIEGFICNGIDRLDNNKGYESGNVVPCCKQCNRAKLKRNQEEFMVWIKKSYFHMGLDKSCTK